MEPEKKGTFLDRFDLGRKDYDRAVLDVQAKNRAYHAELRQSMIEYRLTFGWSQPHGPSPDDHHGHYTTIFAPSHALATEMAYERYGRSWFRVYSPDEWCHWDPSMHGIKQLEVLQHYAYSFLRPYPETNLIYDGIHTGCGLASWWRKTP